MLGLKRVRVNWCKTGVLLSQGNLTINYFELQQIEIVPNY